MARSEVSQVCTAVMLPIHLQTHLTYIKFGLKRGKAKLKCVFSANIAFGSRRRTASTTTLTKDNLDKKSAILFFAYLTSRQTKA
ncbi:MAG: hypothetical protein K2L70_03080 [Clostridia bacterium]|nr:hypothetical protein [Clostridia bacterium]